ncbi:MAG: hypothetical protein HY675_11400 [Chloroflexi bacterium]|nr:hypothetical protein [Chloroflexota bacterium]
MLGILKGMKVTLEHALKSKVTRKYPYEKRELPERSRGLIQLTTEPETGVLKCEACLLCEKVCPPRAITISYSERNAFRRRPLFRPRTKSAYYGPRMAIPAPYEGRPLSVPMEVPGVEQEFLLDMSKVDELLEASRGQSYDLIDLLNRVQSIYGYVPRAAVLRISQALDKGVSDIYAAATVCPQLRLKPPVAGKTSEATEGRSPRAQGGAEVD